MKHIFMTAFLFAVALTVHSQPSTNEIVFCGSPGLSYNGTQVYSMRSDGSGQVNLTNDTTVPNFSPSWSPDGSKIVFIKNWAVWIMNADGTSLHQLATPPSGSHDHPAWSPDGSKIAFEVTDGFTVSSIFVMNADGTNQTQLTPFDNYNSGADWSPDGSKIAFSRIGNLGYNINIYVMNADGKGLTAITNSTHYAESPKWSPDGSKIAFMMHNGMNYTVYIMNADGSNPVQLTNTSAPANDMEPSWSPDGKELVFSSDREGLYNIYVMNADGTNVVRLTQNTFDSFSPHWKRVVAPSALYQLSGRVTTPDGRGLRNATVFMTDSLGARRTVMTSAFGYYLFDNIAGGEMYTLGVASKLYRFAPQTMQVTGTLTDVNFMGLE